MIASFCDEWLRAFFQDDKPSRTISGEIRNRLFRKLQMLDDAINDADLRVPPRVPPSNHFEKLKGKLEGWRSIKVNDQWRLAFEWKSGEARSVYLDDHSYR